jgi:hypothetical protein
MQIFTLIPAITLGFIIVLILLSGLIAGLRFKLYETLKDINNILTELSTEDPKSKKLHIVDELQERYKKASEKLDHVNTIALIDTIYKDQIISYGAKLQYDRADSVTRSFPNLLIAFGLIGTFWGITSNLTNISSIVTGFSQSNPDVGKLVQGLQSPLSDMGVAFSTSLCGLICGSLLTLANTWWNTSIAKYQLISSLEDYLDNTCNKGTTRLDLAIKTMVDQQKNFLDRFHDNVGDILAESFGAAAKKITEECSELNTSAQAVYNKLDNAAGTISTGASTFEYAANSLKQQTKILSDSLDRFQGGVETFNIAANKLEGNNIVQNIDRVLAKLSTTQQAFTTSTQTLQDSLVGITDSNQTAAQLARQVYETWQDSTTQIVAASETIGAGAIVFQKSANSLELQTQAIVDLLPQLKAGVHTFVAAANKVKTNNIIKHLDTLVENLNTTQSAFTSSTQILATGVEGIMSSHHQATKIAERVYQGLEMTTDTIQTGANNFERAAQTIQASSRSIDLTLTNAANQWQYTQTEFTNSTAIFSQAAQNIEPVAAQLEPAITSIDRAINSLQQVGSEIVNLSKSTIQISESTQTAITGFDRNYHQVLTNTQSSIQNIAEVNSTSWQKLIDSLDRQERATKYHQPPSIQLQQQN